MCPAIFWDYIWSWKFPYLFPGYFDYVITKTSTYTLFEIHEHFNFSFIFKPILQTLFLP